jgi:hypothetical protein
LIEPTYDDDLALLRRVIAGLEADRHAELSPEHARQRVVGARSMAAIIARRHPEGSVVGSDVYRSLDQLNRLCNEIHRTLGADA